MITAMFDLGHLPYVTLCRFWEKVDVKSPEECWNWTGSRNPQGYGNFRVPTLGRATFGTHRVSYMIYNGRFPEQGLVVRHKCDNPSCVNPLHLEKGTVSDNVRDAVERGQLKPRDQRGTRNPSARLNEEKVLQIRERLKREHYRDLAKEYGVCVDMIMRIQSRKSWAHI